jgi:hypothetical protein
MASHACNPRYSGGRDWEDCSSRLKSLAKSLLDTYFFLLVWLKVYQSCLSLQRTLHFLDSLHCFCLCFVNLGPDLSYFFLSAAFRFG